MRTRPPPRHQRRKRGKKQVQRGPTENDRRINTMHTFDRSAVGSGVPQAKGTVGGRLVLPVHRRRRRQPLRAGLRGPRDVRPRNDAADGRGAAGAAASLLADDAAGDEGPARVPHPRRPHHFVIFAPRFVLVVRRRRRRRRRCRHCFM